MQGVIFSWTFQLAMLCILAVLHAPQATAADPSPPPTPDTFRHNGITAHRGNQAAAAENTLQAFADAIAVGADWIELDVFTTQDGKVVVSHDATTGRVGDRDLKIADATYDELRKVDVAAAHRKKAGLSAAQCPPAQMPLLTDALALIKRHPDVRLSIQPKDGSTDLVVKLVQAAGMVRQVGFNDGSLPKMARVKELEPGLAVFWDRPAKFDIEADLATARKHRFDAIVVAQAGVTQEVIRRIRAAGFEAGAWTVNDPATIARFLDWGIDRIYTDRPDVALKILQERAKPAAAGKGAKGAPVFRPVECEGRYPAHLQGICTNDADAIFWCFTTTLVRTDLAGKVAVKVPVASHHGDLCYRDGKLYVAVNLGKFNEPEGKADNWVYVYDAATLKELARHRVPEVAHGAGGIAWRDGTFYVVGGLPPDAKENLVYAYDENFTFRKRHVLPGGHTDKGIQTAAFAAGRWWFGCYGKPAILLTADPAMQKVSRFEIDASLGIVGLPDGRLLVARGINEKGAGHSARLVIAEADEKQGFKVVGPAEKGK